MDPPVEGGASINTTKIENQNSFREEQNDDSNGKLPNQSGRFKFFKKLQKRTKNQTQKFKKGFKIGADKIKKDFKVGAKKALKIMKESRKKTDKQIVIDEGEESKEREGIETINKGSKYGLGKLKKDFWIGATIIKEGIQIGIKKLKKASVIGTQMARSGFKNAKEKMKKLRVLNANFLLRAKEDLKKIKGGKKKLNENIKNKAKKIGRQMKKMQRKIELGCVKTLNRIAVLNERMKVRRVTFCVWFMYNYHTMKLMCLECWMIENPHVIINSIKKRESACATLIPIGYGTIIHKSLILAPSEYFDDSKKALKGEVLITFGSQMPHSPGASCIASDVEIERGFVPFFLEHRTNPLSSMPSKDSSKDQSQHGSKFGSNRGSNAGSKIASKTTSPTYSKQGSRTGSKCVSKTASRAGTPPSSPKKQHTHKLLPTRIFLSNKALDLTLLACDPLPKSIVPLGLGEVHNGRNMDLYRRVYILGYKKQSLKTNDTLSIGMGRIIDMDKLFVKFGTLSDNWLSGSIGFDERGNFAFVICNPLKMEPSSSEKAMERIETHPILKVDEQSFVCKRPHADDVTSICKRPHLDDQPSNSNSIGEPSNFEKSQINDEFQSTKISTTPKFGRNGYILSHRSAFGIKRYEIEDPENGGKFKLKENIEHTGVIVQGIRQWIIQHWDEEGLSFNKLVPPLGWRPFLIQPIPFEYDSYTHPLKIRQKWSKDYNKPPTYSEMTQFMDVYNRLATLKRECSKAEREHINFKHQRLSSIMKNQCSDEEAHGANLINPGCSKFRKRNVLMKDSPLNPIRRTSGAIRRALAHRKGHQDHFKSKGKKDKDCQGCI